MVPQYDETLRLMYARLTFVAFMTQRYGAMNTDELASLVVLCNRIIARSSTIELMQLFISETIYAKADGSGYEIPMLTKTLRKLKEGTLDPDFTRFASDIRCLPNGKFHSDEIRGGWRVPELSTEYLMMVQDTFDELSEHGWHLRKLFEVAHKYPEMAAALKEPDLRVWDHMHLLEASPDLPNLGELTDAQKDFKYSE